ncbi:TonB-dependent receptor [Sphingomonas sp. HITSZ_GF]|uniref:TonB-dependent receptor domain-containing protein n=1 Tax=Sphingomonas sp. HITSZ_GF TaxID=3037247 RepID=UPI00240E6C00|nr:TonB-dependent receptor [Sphingomonas sp. HITSZ_GF]MDG2534116.1 TonB-dependent receptor [Sphingomonas sp. HITSZ_GF]
MRRAELILPLALLVAPPALAQEKRHGVSVPAGRLDAAVFTLGRQTGSSIGLREPGLGGIKVRGVKGKRSVDGALAEMLKGTGARARRVAPGTWLIERAPPERMAARPRPAPPPPEEPDAPPAEILVTGSKRDIPLKAYPGGVQIVEGSDIPISEGGKGSDVIANRVASLASTHLGPGRNKLFIRGIADSSFVGPTQATVGQYWGNSRITYSAPDPDLKLYDIGRVEVLEGPQGTLYGAGSLGGVVRVVPRAPDFWATGGQVWGGGALTEHGSPSWDVGGIVNLPIKEGELAVRALVFSGRDGGYIDDRERGLKDVNSVRTTGGRAALRWEVDGWTIDLNGVGQSIKGNDAQYSDGEGNGLSRASSIAQPFQNDFWLGELVTRKRWGDLELSSAVAYAQQYVSEVYAGASVSDVNSPSLPAVNAPLIGYQQINRVNMLTTETRLARRGPRGTGWLIGVSFLENRGRVNRSFGSRRFALTGVRNTVDEATLYGEATVEPVRGVTITGGGRLTRSHLTGNAQDADRFYAFREDPAAKAARTETRLLPSAAIAYQPYAGLTLFGRFEQGFRPGGLAVRRDVIQRFEGDRLSTIEAGTRYSGNGLSLMASASMTWWTSIQADLIDGFGFPTTSNIGDGRVLSLGFVARWRPLPGLDLDGSLYLNGSKVTNPSQAVFPLAEGPSDFNRLPNVADASGRLGAAYRTRLGGETEFSTSTWLRYVGKSTLGIGPVLGKPQGDYVDTALEFRLERGRRALTLSATNLLDTRGNRFALGSPLLIRDDNQMTPLRPRTVRLGVEIGF